MGKVISILLVGIGGYGQNYVEEILDYNEGISAKIVGVVDPMPENCKYIARIKALNIPIFNTIEAVYEKLHADLTVISSPIQFHCQQSCYALSK